MKYLYTLLTICIFILSLDAQIVDFEDDNFKQYIVSLGYDTNTDGEIQIVEADMIIDLEIIGADITSIVGIKEFSNLNSLNVMDELSVINVSGMESLKILSSIGSTNQTDVFASNCVNLTDIWLDNSGLGFGQIDLSNCSSLQTFQFDNFSFVENINLENCSALTSLNIWSFESPNLELNLQGCAALRTMDLMGGFNELVIMDLPLLEEFWFMGDLVNLEMQNLPSLKLISMDNSTPDFDLILDGFMSLENVSFYSIEMNNLSLRNCAKLESVDFLGWAKKIDLTGCIGLKSVGVMDVENLILKDCIALDGLFLAHSVDSLDLEGAYSIEELEIHELRSHLNVRGCFNITSVSFLLGLDIALLDFSSCPKLEYLDLSGFPIIETLVIKNGSREIVEGSYNVENLCVDLEDLEYINSLMNDDLIEVVNLTTDCDFADGQPYIVRGKSLLDVNQDNCLTSDVVLPYSKYKLIDSEENERFFFANSEGSYTNGLFEGQYTYGPDVLYGNDLFTLTPEESMVDFPTDGAAVNVDFCFQPGLEVDIIDVTLIPLEAARPGFDCRYLITYKNTGNVTRGGDIKLTFQDDLMDLVSSEPDVDVQEEGFLSWSFEELIPYETRSIEFTMNMNSPMEIPPLVGDEVLEFQAMVGPLGNQTVSAYWSDLSQPVVNSFDPNDKTCLNGDVLDESMIGDFVKYMIRFENTGTADAVNIVVKDTIDQSTLDIRTLEVLNASHDVVANIEGNVVSFIFKDVYLPFEDATNDGYVTFKIKTLETLSLGDNLQNRAGIYFDFNFPIITNTTSTIISDLTNVSEPQLVELEITLSPNPSDGVVYIESTETINSAQIYTLSGKLVKNFLLDGQKHRIQLNVDELPKGAYQIKIISDEKTCTKRFVKM